MLTNITNGHLKIFNKKNFIADDEDEHVDMHMLFCCSIAYFHTWVRFKVI